MPAYSRPGHAGILPPMHASSTPELNPELAVSVVLFHSPLEHLQALIDSLIASLVNAQALLGSSASTTAKIPITPPSARHYWPL